MSRFDDFDEVPVPDQWDEIGARAERADVPALEPAVDPWRRRRSVLAGAVALILVVALAAALLERDDGSELVADGPSTSTLEPNGNPAHGGEPLLLCADGGLVAPDVPEDSAGAPRLVGHLGERRTHTWTAGDLRFELLVPGLQYIDFVGERVREVQQPSGLLFYRDQQTHFLGETGLVGPCDSYELIVEGGDEAQREGGLLAVASTFSFDPTLGVTDCGDLTYATLQVTEGANAMAAVRDIEALDIALWPRGLGDSIPDIEKRADGRCEVEVASRGGLRPVATISGRDGRYGLDTLRGFAPDGVGAEDSTLQMDVPASVQVVGAEFHVLVDYWCSDCAKATMTIHYPDDDITATAMITAPGAFIGKLPRPSGAGSYGVIAITWSDDVSDARGIWTTNIASGDFAAS